MLLAYFSIGAGLFWMAYRWYGRYLDRRLAMSDSRPTPAYTLRDDVDYLPTPDPVLFGHHFSSIAGAGPIVGPIIAGLAFGWLPAALWIVAGAIFIGGVHDYTAMAAGIRHNGLSIAEIARARLPRTIYLLFLMFILLTLIYVIIVFLDLTAAGFAPAGESGAAQHQGGAVASAAIGYILLALAFGFVTYRRRWPLRRASLACLPLLFAILWLAMRFPLLPEYLPAVAGSAKNFWIIVLLLYCLTAAILPVWILLQPRDYISSFLLYACLTGGTAGLLTAGLRGQAPVNYPAFIGWHDPQLGPIFPALFITVACGAVSGFHAIVASGTSARQLRRETSVRRIGYGGMLLEGLLALMALATVMILNQRAGAHPVENFAAGMGVFMGALGIPAAAARTFAMLAVSTFLLTTLDTCTRLARFILQELMGLSGGLRGRISSTLAVLAIPALTVFHEIPGPTGQLMPAWQAIWPAFGTTNQLLAALALLCVFLWLRESRRAAWFVGLPMCFMAVTTLTALTGMAWHNLRDGSRIIGSLSLLLGLLALTVIIAAIQAIRGVGHRTVP